MAHERLRLGGRTGWQWVAAILVVSLLGAACGSTARQQAVLEEAGRSGTGELGGDGLTAEDGTPLDGTEGGAGGGSSGTVGSSVQGGGTRTTGPGSGGGSSGGGGSGGGSSGGGGSSSNPRGVTDTEIRVGIEYVLGEGEAAQSAGSDADTGNMKLTYQTFVDDLNNRGGLFGRKVKPFFRAFDATGDRGAVQEQANCEGFVRDDRVFAVLSSSNIHSDTFRQCLEDGGVAHLGSGGPTASDRASFTRFPHYGEAGSLNLSRLAQAYVDGLVSQGFFKAAASETLPVKIGLVSFDSPAFVRARDQVLKPALVGHGLRLDEEALAPQPYRAADLPATSAAVQSAVLAFRQRGVTRVLFLATASNLAVLFMNSAQSQGWNTVRYGLTTQDIPVGVLSVPTARPQLQGAMGVGWFSGYDLNAADDPTTPQQQRCLDLLRAAGNGPNGRTTEALARVMCDHVRVFEAAVKAGGPALSANAFVAGLERVGTSLAPAAVSALGYGPGRRDGVAAVRAFRYEPGCTCFRYSGGPQSL